MSIRKFLILAFDLPDGWGRARMLISTSPQEKSVPPQSLRLQFIDNNFWLLNWQVFLYPLQDLAPCADRLALSRHFLQFCRFSQHPKQRVAQIWSNPFRLAAQKILMNFVPTLNQVGLPPWIVPLIKLDSMGQRPWEQEVGNLRHCAALFNCMPCAIHRWVSSLQSV